MKVLKARNFLALSIYTFVMDVYFCLFFYAGWDWVYCKLLLGINTCCCILWLIIDAYIPRSTAENFEMRIVTMVTLAFNSLLSSLISADIINNGRTCLILFNGFVFVTTVFILIGGIRHGAFKN